MKKIIVIALLFMSMGKLFGQLHGINYQAIIIDKNIEELPGVDVSGNYLPNHDLTVRFTILDANSAVEYQEEQVTRTDSFGMINLVIGWGTMTTSSPNVFKEISWDGTSKQLRVEILVADWGSDYIQLSQQETTFVPYAYHRNITATGTMIIDSITTLKNVLYVTNKKPANLSGTLRVEGQSTFFDNATFLSNISVDGVSNLDDSLNVNNASPTYLTGDLTVDGKSKFNGEVTFNDIVVNGTTNLNDSVFVNKASPTYLSGSLTVDSATVLDSSLTVNATSFLNARVIINANVNADQGNPEAYPLRVEGSNQGIYVRVDGSSSHSTNFVTFKDSIGIKGRIEGETTEEVFSDPEYIYNNAFYILEEVMATARLVAACTSFTPCAGLGFCVTVPIPSLIVAAAADLVAKTAELVAYNTFRFTIKFGVAYSSSGADYAEWLPKANLLDEFYPGDIVGVKGGFISSSVDGADQILVVSKLPVVLGNTPPAGKENDYEKLAFMGQVPVKVLGKVKLGDYIIATGNNTGFGIAMDSTNMTVENFQRMVGVAWSSSDNDGFNVINVAVNFNSNATRKLISKRQAEIVSLEEEINRLKAKINKMNKVVGQLVPEYTGAISDTTVKQKNDVSDTKGNVRVKVSSDKTTITKEDGRELVYFNITREQLLEGFTVAEEMMREKGIDVDNHPFFSKVKKDSAYKEEVISGLLKTIEKQKKKSMAIDSK
jgi:hypothetical protein